MGITAGVATPSVSGTTDEGPAILRVETRTVQLEADGLRLVVSFDDRMNGGKPVVNLFRRRESNGSEDHVIQQKLLTREQFSTLRAMFSEIESEFR